ncbi:MAG: SRPBCC domain-containing protein [Lunatimonas sp.]|uniref:SRPBCC domain-containing protein n=1 Tax=Lunatimonas sp. TaxID=2060141 RepID=UPI00263A48EE|nr:SRPBCC domain-containing protein [Lunatimonas sp.]MCC5938674.1 SRPBCC domain-containing protein [Lunatimonas sp.]
MQKEINTQIHINASREKVWQVLTDFESYGQWNPFVRSITGEVEKGNRINVVLGPQGSRPMTFKPTVLVFDEEREFRWLGRMFFPGIFDGEHIFQLKENGDGSSVFVHREKFRGLLVGLMAKKLDTEILAGFESMNRSLKHRVEQGGELVF